MTLQLQQARGFGPVLAGLAFLPLTLPMVVNPPLAARLVARVGPAGPVLAGLLLIAVSALVLFAASPSRPYGWVAAGLLLLGCGVSLTLPALTSAVVLAAPPGATATAGGLFSVVRQTGATLGVAATAAVLAGGDAGRAHLLVATAAALAAAVWWLRTGGEISRG